MIRGKRLYFLYNGVVMKGEYYKRENGLYLIHKETIKNKYLKLYKVKPEFIITRFELGLK